METDYKGIGRTENAEEVETAHRLATSESFCHLKSGATEAGVVFSEPKGWAHTTGARMMHAQLYIFLNCCIK